MTATMWIDMYVFQNGVRFLLALLTLIQWFVGKGAWNPDKTWPRRHLLPGVMAVLLVAFYVVWIYLDFEISGWSGPFPRTFSDYFLSFRLIVYGYPLLLALVPPLGWLKRRPK